MLGIFYVWLQSNLQLKAFMDRCCTLCHYFVVIKKCGSSECSMCTPPRLPAESSLLCANSLTQCLEMRDISRHLMRYRGQTPMNCIVHLCKRSQEPRHCHLHQLYGMCRTWRWCLSVLAVKRPKYQFVNVICCVLWVCAWTVTFMMNFL